MLQREANPTRRLEMVPTLRRAVEAALCLVCLCAGATPSLGQDLTAVVRGVSISFASEGGDTRSKTVSFAFASEGGTASADSVSFSFHDATDAAVPPKGVSIAFESAPPPAAMLGMPRNSAFNADPVNTATGNYVFDHTDLEMPGPGLSFAFTRFYNSLDDTPGPVGIGWTHSYHLSLTEEPVTGNVAVRWGDAHVDSYLLQGGSYVHELPGIFDTLVKNPDGTFVVKKKDQREYRFGAGGSLTSIVDRNGNTQTLAYDGAKLASVTDTGGRVVTFSYDTSNRLVEISDPLPRTVTFDYDATGHLASVTDVNSGVESYTYDGNHQLLTATDPRGFVYLTNTYDAAKRVVTWQADAKGNQYQFSYDEAIGQTTITDPLGRASIDAHDQRKRLIRQTDRLDHSVSYTYDNQNNRTSITDKNGHTTTYSYSEDGMGNVAGKMDPLYRTTAITYDTKNNPLTHDDELGQRTTFEYDANGNLLKTIAPMATETTFTYNARGQVLTSTDANGGVTTFTYDPEGNATSVAEPLGRVTTYAYDAIGRRVSARDARGNTTTFAYDGRGNLLGTTDALTHAVTHEYDGNSNRVKTTDAMGRETRFAYQSQQPADGRDRRVGRRLDEHLRQTGPEDGRAGCPGQGHHLRIRRGGPADRRHRSGHARHPVRL